MLKAEFLGQLQKALLALPAAEVERQRNYYSELIDDMMEDGLSEIEAITRLGRVEDVAGIVSMLASDTCAYMTGQILTVDGGISL